MSLSRKETIACPKCKKNFEVTIWNTVNTDLAEDVAELIVTGKFFVETCPHCGYHLTLNYPLLYQDLKHKAMVWIIPRGEGREKKIAEIRGGLTVPEYTTRMVAGIDQLREKVSALESGRDDRVLELLKWSLVQNLQKQMPNFRLREVLYLRLEGKEAFHFYSTEGGYLCGELVEEQYQFIKNKFAGQLEKFDGLPYPEVNYLWASALWANA